MGNILNNNFHNLKLRTNRDEYWDIFVNKDGETSYYSSYNGESLYDDCLLAYIDASIDECVSGRNLVSVEGYKWESATTSNYTLCNIGYTGVDNFLIPFHRDSCSNKEFIDIYSGSTYDIVENDTRLKLHAISGSTALYQYPFTIEKNRIKLNGGFYQGFFKTECGKYEILPSKLEIGDTWEFEFFLNKTEFEKESDKTLNDKYPENKGIFFYIGTRAENKWVYLYNKEEEGEFGNLNNDDIMDYVDDTDMPSNALYGSGDMIVMPTPFEEVFFDDYLSFKYYDDDLYKEGCLDSDDFALNDYAVIERKPNVIDEKNNPSKVIGWCCNFTTELKHEDIRTVCCGCGCCRNVKTISEYHYEKKGHYSNSCDYFGDDYLEDFEGICDEYIESEVDPSKLDFATCGDELPLNIGNQYYFDTDNKFLFFDRTCDGFNVHNWHGDTLVRYYGVRSNFSGNLFLLMNRTCTGYTVHTIDEYRDTFVKKYNVYNDIYNNALAFRITDEGAIGYRYLTLDCDSETQTTIREGYSKNGIIKEGEWTMIHVTLDASYKTMVLRFYVNDNLVFVTDPMDRLNLRQLNELYQKQESVPFNISLGGGTQGLGETILPDYMRNPSRLYPLEKNFAGTFIGYIKSFRFYNCYSEYLNILNNFKYEINNLG